MDAQLIDSAQWGKLPFDLFVLEKWDPSSTEDARAQGARLAIDYVKLGLRGRQPYHEAIREGRFASPTQTQIETILEPMQTIRERNLSSTIHKDKSIWLRTCYENGSDAKHAELLSSLKQPIEEITNGRGHECLFDDMTLYDYGSHWDRIFTRFPELVADPFADLDRKEKKTRDARAEALREWKEEEVDELDYEAFLHYHVTAHFFVEDRETLFGNGRMLIVWLDDQGRVVRETRIDTTEQLYEVFGLCSDGSIYECSGTWLDGEVGPAYQHDGELGLLSAEEC
ncbi:hypothetical protein L228DRAFT_249277 [Xylona heveae TC161]|uniref:Uncharacterized protein n=1 Tax=Xylona heveae (strain CBS 132557 / TC161) TaxID=1328760 RepID=A0A165AIA1_XYLHT|nr:hypothetical protein L228DRAFT_249277 [Xylona heveae TC161]KZF20521.1 hypothetical protein L228DRAFT_249277 [Xylona heveae TC161]